MPLPLRLLSAVGPIPTSDVSPMSVPAPAESTAAVEPFAAEKVFSGLGALWTSLRSLSAEELALNLGLSALVVLGAMAVIYALRRAFKTGLEQLAPDHPARRAPGRTGRITRQLLQICLGLAALVLLLSIWGLDLISWLSESGAGATLVRLAGVIIIAAALVEGSGHLVDHLLSSLVKRTEEARRTAQIRTLGPLIRGAIQGFLIIVAALTVLSEVGLNIGPLLASAGVLGLAVGFGAQTLVKDFLTGFFLVAEDIVAVGDNIQIGDKSGTVEAMTLRTIRVRNMDGTLHILPHSEAQIISNRTKSFSAYVFKLGIGYTTDIDHTFEVMRRVGAELQADPAFGDKILQPLEILGVDELGDSAVVLKARFRTRPGDQWAVGREYNHRIKLAFDAEGIEIPYPYRKLVIDSVPSASILGRVNGGQDAGQAAVAGPSGSEGRH